MGINPMNKITIIIRILFAVTLFQHPPTRWMTSHFTVYAKTLISEICPKLKTVQGKRYVRVKRVFPCP
jgi:hypothetical protein